MRSYIRNGWVDKIINPDQLPQDGASGSITAIVDGDQPATPDQCSGINWKALKSAYSCPDEVPSFSNGQMVTYFVSRTVSDGLPAGDFKTINTHAKKLFDCGHVQCIETGSTTTHLWI